MSQQITISGLTNSLKKVVAFLQKRLKIIFVIIALFMLVYSVFSVNSLLSAPSDEAYRTQQESKGFSTHFDQKTVKSINDLSNRQSTGSTALPAGRINPFSE